MTVIVSAFVRRIKSADGGDNVDGWFLLESRSASYQPGGEAVDLTPHYRNTINGIVGPASGALLDGVFHINEADLGAAGVVSTRIKVLRPTASALVFGEVVSGIAVSGTRQHAHIIGY